MQSHLPDYLYNGYINVLPGHTYTENNHCMTQTGTTVLAWDSPNQPLGVNGNHNRVSP